MRDQDLVRVIRCKDCKQARKVPDGYTICRYGILGGGLKIVPPYGFCNNGIHKDEDEDDYKMPYYDQEDC